MDFDTDDDPIVRQEFLERLTAAFPAFAAKLGNGERFRLESVKPPATDDELNDLERRLGVKLPDSYRAFLRCARQFRLSGGSVQFGPEHPFFHRFDPFENLPPRHQHDVLRRGYGWPPPSDGMLCFAEYFLMADGDQLLFDVAGGLIDGEYPVLYYDHEANPPAVRRLADGFAAFMERFPDDPAFD